MATLSCGRDDVRWRTREWPAFQDATGHFLPTAASEDLQKFLKVDQEGWQRHAFICFDAPGMGKTTTVARAANVVGCVHILLQCGTGIMSSHCQQNA